MSIDNFICVPTGARNNRDGSDTKYNSGDRGRATNYTRQEVTLTHGMNVLLQEQYLCEDEMDALWFWEEGYKERLFEAAGSDGESQGYEKMTLWLKGKLQAQRSKPGV